MAVRAATPERFWYVKQLNIFQDLSESDANALERITTFKQLKYGDTISTEGVYLIKEGRVKIYETPPEGEPVTIEVLEPGEILGAVEWDDTEAQRNVTAETLTEVVIGIVSTEHFQFFLKRKMHLVMPFKRPLHQRVRSAINAVICRLKVSATLTSNTKTQRSGFPTTLPTEVVNLLHPRARLGEETPFLLGRFLSKQKHLTSGPEMRRGMTNPFSNIAFRSPASRLALLLQNYADAPTQNRTGSQCILRPLSTKKIAQLIGCSVENTEALLNQFKGHKVLKKRYRRIQLLDPWQLKKIANARMASLPPNIDKNRENTETYAQNEPLPAVRPTDGR